MKLARTMIDFAIALPGIWIAGTAAETSSAPALLALSHVVLGAYGVPCAVGIAGSLQRQSTLLVLALGVIVLLTFPDMAGITGPAMALAIGAGVGALIRRIVQESQDPLASPQDVPHPRPHTATPGVPQWRPRPVVQEIPQERPLVLSQEVPHERPRLAGQ